MKKKKPPLHVNDIRQTGRLINKLETDELLAYTPRRIISQNRRPSNRSTLQNLDTVGKEGEMMSCTADTFKLIQSGIAKAKTKHIDIKHLHAYDEQEKGNIQFPCIESENNLADTFTKALPRPRHQTSTS